MTKEKYFEMCEMLNSEPKDEEVPVEYLDLPLDVQEAYSIYLMMQDMWDYMSGAYIGKNYSGISDILNIMGIEDKRTIMDILLLVDNYRREAVERSKPKSPPA